jgi:hypothetical protein
MCGDPVCPQLFLFCFLYINFRVGEMTNDRALLLTSTHRSDRPDSIDFSQELGGHRRAEDTFPQRNILSDHLDKCNSDTHQPVEREESIFLLPIQVPSIISPAPSPLSSSFRERVSERRTWRTLKNFILIKREMSNLPHLPVRVGLV